MKTIEEITFNVNNHKCTYKVYKYEDESIRQIKVPAKIGETTLHMGYKYVDTKVKVTKYALHQEYEKDGNYQDRLVCETEMYATILTIIKGIMQEYIENINKLQTPTI